MENFIILSIHESNLQRIHYNKLRPRPYEVSLNASPLCHLLISSPIKPQFTLFPGKLRFTPLFPLLFSFFSDIVIVWFEMDFRLLLEMDLCFCCYCCCLPFFRLFDFFFLLSVIVGSSVVWTLTCLIIELNRTVPRTIVIEKWMFLYQMLFFLMHNE